MKILKVLMILTIAASELKGQTKVLSYRIIQGGSKIGFLTVCRRDSANCTDYSLNSEFEKRIIFLFRFSEKQVSRIENGQLKYSTVLRKVNGTVKTNSSLKMINSGYEIWEDNVIKKSAYKFIQHNQLYLYFEEPVFYHEVYSDQFQCMLKIEKTDTNTYSIRLPDGNMNYYYYKDKVCYKIMLYHKLFKAELLLN